MVVYGLAWPLGGEEWVSHYPKIVSDSIVQHHYVFNRFDSEAPQDIEEVRTSGRNLTNMFKRTL